MLEAPPRVMSCIVLCTALDCIVLCTALDCTVYSIRWLTHPGLCVPCMESVHVLQITHSPTHPDQGSTISGDLVISSVGWLYCGHHSWRPRHFIHGMVGCMSEAPTRIVLPRTVCPVLYRECSSPTPWRHPDPRLHHSWRPRHFIHGMVVC